MRSWQEKGSLFVETLRYLKLKSTSIHFFSLISPPPPRGGPFSVVGTEAFCVDILLELNRRNWITSNEDFEPISFEHLTFHEQIENDEIHETQTLIFQDPIPETETVKSETKEIPSPPKKRRTKAVSETTSSALIDTSKPFIKPASKEGALK